jgi:RHS repeat-associated protein
MINHYKIKQVKQFLLMRQLAAHMLVLKYLSNLKKIIDSNRTPAVEALFDCNLDNILKKKTYTDGKYWTYTPDKRGLVKTFKNARNITKNYTYDNNHNLLAMTYFDTTPPVTFTPDDYNRLWKMDDGIGHYEYTYDANNRLRFIDGPWANDTIEMKYNALGQTTDLIPQAGQAINYVYDTIGRLTDIKPSASTFTYAYSGVNPLIQSLTRPNGSKTKYNYNDPLKRLTDVINRNSSNQVINSFKYTYNDQDVRESETITNGQAITSFTEGLKTYTPNNVNQTISSTNPNRSYVYDADGNMTTGYTPDGYALTMTYDAENRMTSAEYTDSSSVIHRTEYSYNGFSLLAEMKKYDGGVLASSTRYLRAGFLPVQERDVSNTVTREYTWGLNYGGGVGGLLNLKQGGLDYNYLYDGKGNVSALINSAQSVVASYASIDQSYMFSTKPYDPKTGLSYYGYRFYSPSIGKWTTRDPLGEYGDINLYRAMRNSAMNWVDPLGFYIGQMPPMPPDYDPWTWKPGTFADDTPYLEDPTGRKWITHPEDIGHWRHWDKQGPDGKDEGRWPPNSKKPPCNQKKKPKPDQSTTDPSGNEPPFAWPKTNPPIPFMPLDPIEIPTGIPIRIPIRIPIPVW